MRGVQEAADAVNDESVNVDVLESTNIKAGVVSDNGFPHRPFPTHLYSQSDYFTAPTFLNLSVLICHMMRHPAFLCPLRTLFSTPNSDSQRTCWLYILIHCCYTILKASCKAFLTGDPYARDLAACRAILLIRHATCALPLSVSNLNQLQKKSPLH